MGTPKNPSSIQSWDAGLATQLSTNGGSRRPQLEWMPGNPITRTRLTVPLETLRAASLDEESYLRLARVHHSQRSCGMNFDSWVRELVNLGVPVSTSAAIDRQVQNVLKRARTEPTDHCVEKHAMRAYLSHRNEGLDQDDAST